MYVTITISGFQENQLEFFNVTQRKIIAKTFLPYAFINIFLT